MRDYIKYKLFLLLKVYFMIKNIEVVRGIYFKYPKVFKAKMRGYSVAYVTEIQASKSCNASITSLVT